ncbi:helix-turn-helix domain-containing protein [Candidatus Gottesmanbacteria bacterium]|nr:helix-turn-helix domain-containing protein [Candidatus Gottesmanbacteria bacterium]
MNQEWSVIDKLAAFGLTEEEARLYAALLGKPAQTILAVSRQLSLPRTTVYDLTASLIEKGLLERIVEYKRMKVRAFAPEILEGTIQREKERVTELEKNLAFLKTQLPHGLDLATQTQLRYYHGPSGFRQMMWNALSARGEHVGYSTFGRSEIVGEKNMEQWMAEMIKRGIKDRVIINPKKESLTFLTKEGQGEFRTKYQHTRTISEKTLYISGDTTIYNNVFAVAWWKEGEVVGVEIENPELVKTQKSIFEILWRQTKPVMPRL